MQFFFLGAVFQVDKIIDLYRTKKKFFNTAKQLK